MNTTWGADPDALEHLAAQMDTWANLLSQHRVTLNAHIHSAPWRGQEADRFRQTWNSRLRPSLVAAVNALRAAEVALRQNAAQQREASAVTTSAVRSVTGASAQIGPTRDWSVPTFGFTAGSVLSAVSFLAGTGVSRVAGGLGMGLDIFGIGASAEHHDVPGTIEGTARLEGDYLKSLSAKGIETGDPAMAVPYLVGVNIDVWTDVAEEARQVDWSSLAAKQTWHYVEANPGAFVSAFGDAAKDLPGKLISDLF